MLSFIAIGLIAVVCYVADSEEVFELKGGGLFDEIKKFSASDGFLSRLTAGTYKFTTQVHEFEDVSGWIFEFVDFKKDLPAGQIKFVLDLNGRTGCKLEYDDHYFLQHENWHIPVTTIDKKMKYSALIGTIGKPDFDHKISVGVEGDLNCPKNDKFVLIQAGFSRGGLEAPYGLLSSCRGGKDRYFPGKFFGVEMHRCSVGEDLIIGKEWPEAISRLDGSNGSDVSGFNVIVCRLHPHSNICVLYKRSGDDESKFELQNMDDENKKLRQHNRRLKISKANGGVDSSDKKNKSSSPDGDSKGRKRRRGTSPNGGGPMTRSRSRKRGAPYMARSRSPTRQIAF